MASKSDLKMKDITKIHTKNRICCLYNLRGFMKGALKKCNVNKNFPDQNCPIMQNWKEFVPRYRFHPPPRWNHKSL